MPGRPLKSAGGWSANNATCVALALLGVAACNARDWKVDAIAVAEEKIRVEVGDPSAQFLNVQVTGDESTGQTCGQVKARGVLTARFIVYIDGTAGPFLAAGLGANPLPHDAFERAWRADCLGEGYKPG